MILNATQYNDTNDQTLLIRYDKENQCAYWCHPVDGSIHGSNVDQYVTFATVVEATQTAKKYGYQVVID